MRRYRQTCPLAQALDLVGERWTLLIVRELLIAPRRFGELAGALEGVGPNLLGARLRRLADADLLDRDDDRRYVLTERGRQLEPALLALARWGLEDLDVTREGDRFEPHWLTLSLRAALASGTPGSPQRSWQLRVAGQPIALSQGPGSASVEAGEAARPGAILETDPATLLALCSGSISPVQARAAGVLWSLGEEAEVNALLDALRLPDRVGVRAARRRPADAS